MKYIINFLAIIGLVAMSHVAVAIDNVVDGDVLTADMVNEVVNATNASTEDIAAAKQALRDESNDGVADGLVEAEVPVEPPPAPPTPTCDGVLGGTGAGEA